MIKALTTAILAPLFACQILYKCPKPETIQSDFVREHFNLTEFANNSTYYELAYKDITQPRICKCITSTKEYKPQVNQVQDLFQIECGGKPYKSNLVFNTTSVSSSSTSSESLIQKGVFVGVWNQEGIPWLSKLRFYDTVVDAKTSQLPDGSKVYDWVIEFQCDQVPSSDLIAFYAFNFYSRYSPSSNGVKHKEHLEEMKASFLSRPDLSRFLTEGSSLHIVDHSDCWYHHQ